MKPVPDILTKAISTCCQQSVDCPKCKSSKGFYCRRPSGRIADEPHGERIKKYQKFISKEVFRNRHAIAKFI